MHAYCEYVTYHTIKKHVQFKNQAAKKQTLKNKINTCTFKNHLDKTYT